ncbi:hypothetical protein D5018_19625 [Parashewanella curva]|uniref:Uncharacterized protein n=1 Tax=Parashewanella curva TaxID=2338552 RepID=A0A3L8PVB3_9GAMM|nr:hypothetical protein [Parashewanella curva]RLV57992.1 hypothetical protein D5018_19625 [Parashewanella curva]
MSELEINELLKENTENFLKIEELRNKPDYPNESLNKEISELDDKIRANSQLYREFTYGK